MKLCLVIAAMLAGVFSLSGQEASKTAGLNSPIPGAGPYLLVTFNAVTEKGGVLSPLMQFYHRGF